MGDALRRAIRRSPNALKGGIQVWIVRTLAPLTRLRGAERGANDQAHGHVGPHPAIITAAETAREATSGHLRRHYGNAS
jgi:hypothetical protein